MLKLLEFQALPGCEKAAYVLKHGQYIHYRIKGWCKIDLYLIGSCQNPGAGFYAELWYYYDLKSVGLVRSFPTAPPLEPYTENIQFRLAEQ